MGLRPLRFEFQVPEPERLEANRLSVSTRPTENEWERSSFIGLSSTLTPRYENYSLGSNAPTVLVAVRASSELATGTTATGQGDSISPPFISQCLCLRHPPLHSPLSVLTVHNG